jgi:hypothetical protein
MQGNKRKYKENKEIIENRDNHFALLSYEAEVEKIFRMQRKKRQYRELFCFIALGGRCKSEEQSIHSRSSKAC